jgi:nicotinamide-nucleotide amidase
VPTAAIVTIGNELVSGDIANTNGSWLAQRLEQLGVDVGLVAAIPDEIETIAAFVRLQAAAFSFVIVTGGLGGTPDDMTREALALAFGVGQAEEPVQAARLRAQFADRNPDYALRWAQLPVGSRAIDNPVGGAPGFAIENVYVLPGLPAEMEEMFELVVDELEAAPPIGSWRRRYDTTESRIHAVLEEAGVRYPQVRIGSYPTFVPERSVEIVLKSSDPELLAAASAWLDQALVGVMRELRR